MKITLIAEGSTKKDRKTLRWGVAFLVGDVLFDAFGRADVFWENVHRYKIDLSRVRKVVISHEDWDHIAGLPCLLRTQPRTKVYICKHSGETLKNMISDNGGIPVLVTKTFQIAPGIFSVGEMRTDTGRGILYEQALVIRSRKGVSVITGCAHPGIVRIVKQARKLFGKIYAVCGGFHMKDNMPEENQKIVEALHALSIQRVLPLHCTGTPARQFFERVYQKHCIHLEEGKSFNV